MNVETLGYTEIIHISKLNKRLLRSKCKDKFLENNPALHGVRITDNMIMTSLIKYYLGYISLEGLENELNNKQQHK